MNKLNKELMRIYMLGFNDELDDVDSHIYIDKIENNAYTLGRTHAFMGDDLSSIDEMNDKQILKIIKNSK